VTPVAVLGMTSAVAGHQLAPRVKACKAPVGMTSLLITPQIRGAVMQLPATTAQPSSLAAGADMADAALISLQTGTQNGSCLV